MGSDSFKRSLELAVCANDILHWFNHWVWTDDPREKHSLRPFDLYPKQVEFLLWLQERERLQEEGIVEKSRGVGMTWLSMGYDLHGWLFRDGFKSGFGSRKLDLVDNIGDPDTIFEKGRILLRNLPSWMLPPGFNDRWMGFCKFVNHANGASITGEGGDQIGRGGRKTKYTVDESAFTEHPDLIERSLSETTNVRIDQSTPNGPGNAFARRRYSGAIPVFTFHFRDDPRKDSEWEAKKRATSDGVTFAQEYDIDYTASIEGICIPATWVRAAVEFKLPEDYNPDVRIIGGFDPADGGKNRSVLIGRRGPLVLPPASWGHLSAGQAAGMARLEAERLNMERVNYDAIGIGTSVQEAWEHADVKPQFIAHAVKWGDPPTWAKWPSGKTSHDMFSNLRAELWWIGRTRFEKTWQVVYEGAVWPADELISIPNDPNLVSNLSLPLVHMTNTGKIQLESKEDMRKRGVTSPDYGDGLMYTFAPYFGREMSTRSTRGGYT